MKAVHDMPAVGGAGTGTGTGAGTVHEDGLAFLVNRLTRELADSRRTQVEAQQKLGRAVRTLEGRTRDLTEARAALSLLLATLDASSEGIIAVGCFGRAMHYNTRFVEVWNIAPERLPHLDEATLLSLQLMQVCDRDAFLADQAAWKSRPDEPHASRVALLDGRVLACRVTPQRLDGKRVGCVTAWRVEG